MGYQAGALVRARGRDWTVLPKSTDDVLLLRPLGGSSAEETALLPALEDVRASGFDLPDPKGARDNHHCRWLRDALRLSNRNSSGPFRSFGRLSFDPHAYQLVPLLLGLRQDPVRLLIADDVGIGKTVEACLIARELLDRGDIERFWVMTPPHLAQQWQEELAAKFHVEAEVVLPGTVAKLDREGLQGQSIFQRPFLVISLDYAKRDVHRQAVLAHAPELIIVDEAHTCTFGDDGGQSRHQRHRLIRELAADPKRHIILVTATPHSGKGGAFRSLVGLLDKQFAELPEELRESDRLALARHYIQRRRADVRGQARFPKREELPDATYKLTPALERLYDDVIELARETIERPGTDRETRIRWWSALSLLRALASSPRAAAATLSARSGLSELATADHVDAQGRESLSDEDEGGDSGEIVDTTLGSDYSAALPDDIPDLHHRLQALAKRARALEGKEDPKLDGAIKQVKQFLADGFTPIVFCRFINTAEYLSEHLRSKLPATVEIRAVTGKLPPEVRTQQVAELGAAREEGRQAVLVATDCLSEGINLQQYFNAVLHYDLAWNPTRHEQREGRVDRFGQSAETVRILTYYGINNRIDGLVLEVLLKKHRQIRSDLKIAIPVPADMLQVQQAIMEGLLLRGKSSGVNQPTLPGLSSPTMERIAKEWTRVSEEEGRSRSIFAQSAIPVEELEELYDLSRRTIGTPADVGRFLRDGLDEHEAFVTGTDPATIRIETLDQQLRDRLGLGEKSQLRVGFEMPVEEGTEYVGRTHPYVQGLADYLIDTALDPELDSKASRCGAIYTAAAPTTVVVLLCRFRFNLHVRREGQMRTLLSEDHGLMAFDLGGTPLDRTLGEALLDAVPFPDMAADVRRHWVREGLTVAKQVDDLLRAEALRRADDLRAQHERVRQAATRGRAGQIGSLSVLQDVEALVPADIVGLYVYVPTPGAGA